MFSRKLANPRAVSCSLPAIGHTDRSFCQGYSLRPEHFHLTRICPEYYKVTDANEGEKMEAQKKCLWCIFRKIERSKNHQPLGMQVVSSAPTRCLIYLSVLYCVHSRVLLLFPRSPSKEHYVADARVLARYIPRQ